MITGILLPIICTLTVLVVVQTPSDLKEITYRLARPCIRPNNLEPTWISCQASLMKSTKWHIPLKKQRDSSLSYLCFILISLSADIETNPGPIDFPCGTCALEVCDTDPAISCDGCGQWFHIYCQSFGKDMYDDLVNTDRSFSWICSNCDGLNFSTSAQSAFSSFSSVNSFSTLSEEPVTPSNPRSPSPIRATSSKQALTVLNINCRSIINKKAEFQTIIDEHRPDIVVGTESWLTKNHLSSEIFPNSLGYTSFRQDRVTDTCGGGVFILVKDNLIATEQKQLKTNCEIIWVKVDTVTTKPIYVAAYYRPDEGDSESLLELNRSLDMAAQLKGTLWLLGDFNFPKFTWDHEHVPSMKSGSDFPSNYETFVNLLDDFSLVQMVNEPTRGENVLDLFLTSNHTLVNEVKVSPGIADHDIVVASINIKPNISKQVPRKVPLFKKANWTDFRTYMNEKKDEILKNLHQECVEVIWSAFKNALQSGISKYIPVKKFGTKRSLPWITQEIKRLVRKRDSLYQKQKRGRPKDRHHFKQVKHFVQSKIKTAYNNYLQNILGLTEDGSDTTGNDSGFVPKKLFSLIKNARQDAQGVSPLNDPRTNQTSSINKEKANILNRQFQSVFSQLSPLKLGQICTDKLQQYFNRNIPDKFKCSYPQMPDININLNGIIKLLYNLRPDKAAGPDEIRPIVLRELRVEIAPVIQLIFEKSLATGTLPSDWTKANVSPIFKKGEKSDPSNYRPISLTCILCKVMEHIIASNITAHFNKHNILYDLQHGFRQKRSCETQLLQLVEDLGRQLMKGNQTDLVLLDFSKAFDKVNHLKLLFKLSQHGVKGNTLNWIRAFLLGRTQAVVLEGERSAEVPVTSGVPQGSVLGPLLFLLYINDLPQNIQSQVRLFADDTAVYLTVTSLEDANILQSDLDTLEEWERTWDMEFNPGKCQVLHITRSRQPLQSQYTLHGQVLESVDSAKYLGVNISQDLSWNHHINEITGKANRTLGFIKRNVKTKNEQVKELAYKTLVRPQVEYASSVWTPHTKENILKIEMTQRRAARWVKNNYSTYDSVSHMLDNLGWRSLENRRIDSRLIMFYKIVYGHVAIQMPTYFEQPQRFTRHMHPLSYRQIHTQTKYYQQSFYPATIVLWNRLPSELVLRTDLDAFKEGVCQIKHRSP